MKQLELIKKRKKTRGVKWGRPISTHTGARRKRESIGKNKPLHITLRLREGLPNLRCKQGAKLAKNAIIGAHQSGISIIHFAILSNHIHLLVEAKDSATLYQAMKSFTVRLSLGIRKWTSSKNISTLGVFRGRYHVEILKTIQQVKNALKYVLLNPAKHFKKAPYIDLYSSGAKFLKWQQLIGNKLILNSKTKELKKRLEAFIPPPQLWITRKGWMKAAH